MLEIGGFAGLMLPARDLELFEADLELPRQGFRPLSVIAADVGARIGYYPLQFFGVEVEGAYVPTEADNGQPVDIWSFRGQAVAQLGLWNVTPFVVVGGGGLGVTSSRRAVGDDRDGALHFGLGVKLFINRYLQARFDFRNIVSPSQGIDSGPTNTIELLLGLSLTFGRRRDRDPEPERPKPLPDQDRDGIADASDHCPGEPGVEPDGCPPPPPDTDGDGFEDTDDRCPNVAGIAPDGCPDPDPDLDQFLNEDDYCPNEPETRNGFEDDDGCPDQIPSELNVFTGTLEGISFQVDSTSLDPSSQQALDETGALLRKHPSIRVEISGHTDSTGAREHNMTLSAGRAETVRRFLVENGIEPSRITTRGAGSDEPIDTNQTAEGRARNRRIEFRILD